MNTRLFLRTLTLAWGMALSVLAAETVAADGSPPMPLSRYEAVTLAASHHPRVEAAVSRKDASAERITQARSGLMPQLSLGERFSTTDNPMWAFGTRLNQERITELDFDPDRLNDPDGIDNFATTFSLRWPLYDSGQTIGNLRQARQGVAVADQALRKTLQAAMADAAAAYDAWLLAKARLQTIDQAIAQSRVHLDTITDRYQAGFVVKSDLLRARLHLARLEQQRLAIDSQITIAAAHLNAAMGQDPQSVWTATDTLTAASRPPGTMAEWESKALKARPEMAELEHHEAIAKTEIEKQRAAHLPNLSLFGDYEINTEAFSGSGDNYTFGAMFELDLFSGGRKVARTREARANLREIESKRRELSTGVVVETRQAFLMADSAWQRISVAAAGVEHAEESLRIVADRYQNGLVTVVDLMEAQTAAEQARFDHLQAIYDYRTARIRLLQAAGTLDAENLTMP